MEERKYRNVFIISLLVILGLATFLLIKPIFIAMIWGVVLAYIFYPLYRVILKVVKFRDIAASIICIIAALIVIIPIWLFTPQLFNEVFNLYLYIQKIDLVNLLKTNFPSFFASDEFARNFAFALNTFISKSLNFVLNYISDFILKIPSLAIQLSITIVTFYFSIRDAHILKEYIKSISPFNQEIEKKFIQNSLDVTNSVIFGHVLIGVLEGILAGISFFIFGVHNALVLTLVAIILGILPLIGPAGVQIPLIIYFFVSGNTFSAIGMTIYYLVSTVIEIFLRTMIVSKRTKLTTYLAFVGSIGGLFVFGPLGLIVGPLVIAYLLVILELYRNKKFSSIFALDLDKKEIP